MLLGQRRCLSWFENEQFEPDKQFGQKKKSNAVALRFFLVFLPLFKVGLAHYVGPCQKKRKLPVLEDNDPKYSDNH